MGVQLSVDDVGTNWSSFEPFKRNSISTVKIDGSFIAGLESTQGINRLVVETVIHMAHSLGMSAIVEWVETAAQVEIVRAFNADAAQGSSSPGRCRATTRSPSPAARSAPVLAYGERGPWSVVRRREDGAGLPRR